jgi:hypothetical protein
MTEFRTLYADLDPDVSVFADDQQVKICFEHEFKLAAEANVDLSSVAESLNHTPIARRVSFAAGCLRKWEKDFDMLTPEQREITREFFQEIVEKLS